MLDQVRTDIDSLMAEIGRNARAAARPLAIATTDEKNRALEREVARLTEDPAAVEKIAREDLSLVAPGDVVLVLPPGFEQKVQPRTTPPPVDASAAR